MTQQLERLLDDDHLETLQDLHDRADLLAASSATYVLHQDVAYDYSAPITDVRQRLMIVPRARHLDQRLLHQRFDVDDASGDGGTVRRRGDRFGNTVLHVRASRVERSIGFRARAVVRRTVGSDTGPAADAWSHPHPTVTRLTRPDLAISDAAHDVHRGSSATDVAEAICDLVHASFTYALDSTSVRTTAIDAWAGRVGVCQDMAHVMIAMCAVRDIPARYVSGHLVGDGASHAWVEVLDTATGRCLAIDPTHNRRTDLRYVTTAVGRDYSDVAPTTGTFVSAGGRGTLRVTKRIRLADIA